MADISAEELSRIKGLIGSTVGPYYIDVEKGMLRKVAEGVGDSNPLWQDEIYAHKTKYGGIVAYHTALLHCGPPQVIRKFKLFLADKIHFKAYYWGNELEYFKPVIAGDIISYIGKLADVQERREIFPGLPVTEGRGGTTLFIIIEVTYKNRREEIVIKGRYTFIRL